MSGSAARPAPTGAGNFLQAIQPEGWARPKGYANGIVAEGRLLFVSGQVGWDAQERFVSDRFAEQWRQALANVLEVVRTAGGGPENVVRMTIYVVDKREYQAQVQEVGAAWKELMGRTWPTMALVQVADLLEEQARVEIEAMAVLPHVTEAR